eukprot:8640828-Pyramimonas_sp.AAC.1
MAPRSSEKKRTSLARPRRIPPQFERRARRAAARLPPALAAAGRGTRRGAGGGGARKTEDGRKGNGHIRAASKLSARSAGGRLAQTLFYSPT